MIILIITWIFGKSDKKLMKLFWKENRVEKIYMNSKEKKT